MEDKPLKSDGYDIEPLLQALGPRGLGVYQIFQMVLQLMALFGVSFSILSVVFIGYQPSFRCADVNISTLETLIGIETNISRQINITYEKCSVKVTSNLSGDVEWYTLPCVEGYKYAADKHISFFTEWDLICGKFGLTELTQTLMMVGQGLGACIFTSLADRFGRKLVHVCCSVAMLAVSVATALAPNYVFLLFCRIITGALQQGTGLVGFTMFIEILPKWLRSSAGVIDGTLWSTGVMLLPFLAYLLRDFSWRYLQMTLAAFSAYVVILPWCLDESLRWLVANGKKTEAEKVLRKASRWNGVQYDKVQAALEAIFHEGASLPLAMSDEHPEKLPTQAVSDRGLANLDDKLDPPVPVEEREKSSEEGANNGGDAERVVPFSGDGIALDRPINGDVTKSIPPIDEEITASDKAACEKVTYEQIQVGEPAQFTVKKYTILDLFRHRSLRKTAVIIWYLWVTNSLTYYGLILTSSNLAGNRFFNFFLQALMELPACICAWLAMRRFPRRHIICGFLCLAAVSMLLSSVLIATVSGAEVQVATNVLSLIGKFAVSGSFNVLFVFCPELFPTNLRTAGLGMSSAAARVGGMVAPYFKDLADIVLWGPGIIFGGMSSLAAYVILHLPETKGRSLPTTLEETQAWSSKNSGPSDVRRREVIYKPVNKK